MEIIPQNNADLFAERAALVLRARPKTIRFYQNLRESR
ncbi:hypothetical protein LEP1GSC188_1490 [Leptospira weilii serovar Topaz str. LT2116]|uniref:Uncharacterized protein n=1 Tax=Leptospira weilii serovar Topaz str. LT2116 TaxID=1088540 RepID=M3G106_9LEPT|nr:hypothetical protein LEP1GSC188_1490 [Leptospira weilii serovar Topaz str. LT2116]